MRHIRGFVRGISVLGVLPFLAASLSAQPPTGTPVTPLSTLAAGQSGRIGFETVTLTPNQFLQGVKEGPRSLIWGDLRLPPVVTWGEFHVPNEYLERRPAVILLHGEDGLGDREAQWAAILNDMEVPTFGLDSFTGRGLSKPFDATDTLSQEAMVVDAYRALALLSTHPRIDPARIALMGFSRGGAAALSASLTRFRPLHGPVGVEFAAYLSFDPVCNATYLDDEQVSERPIRIVHGTTDNPGAVASCRAYIERLRTAGKDVQLTAYPAVTTGDAPSAHPEAVEAVKAILTATFKPHPTGLGVTAAPRADRSQ